ncbi:MAG: phosphomannomutase/phosphoglucomutase [Patescibacteria group bacterium]|nr:phosphomannomutase/phosphoglucomutase [Patescibacteria group bacterium]
MDKINPGIFKAYDIRGVYPQEINDVIFYKIAQAYVKFMGLAGGEKIVLGRDVRLSGPALFAAMRQGLIDHGVDVVDIDVVSTDMMYFTVAHYGYAGGLVITGSHTPREMNGVKMVRQMAKPVSGDSGIPEIRDLVISNYAYKATVPGQVATLDVLDDYLAKVISVIDRSRIKPLKLVANINFGPLARNLKRLQDFLPLEIVWLNETPDGSFPKGRPDPLIPESRTETIELIKKSQVDFGAAWDSDADRIFFYDETGRFLSGYFTSAVLAEYMLGRYPGSKIVIDMKQNWAIIDTVRRAGGTPLPNRTGHSLFKERMIKEDAAFGGEVSAHYFFKDYFYLDNGLIPLLLILDILSTSGKKLSEIYQPYFDKYFAIEETNLKVKDVNAVLAALKQKYADGKLSEIDGVSIDYPDWRFNVRASNTEPLVRLNLEAKSQQLMAEKLKEIVDFIKMSEK